MKKNINKKNLSENLIINKYFNKLNFNKIGTFNFKNDAAYIQSINNKKIVLTTDSISEDLDFFHGDDPKSIAKKIITVNLSDLSAMGVYPFAYLLNIFLPKYIDEKWLRIFTEELLKIQKINNFYLLGGDLSKSSKLSISSTFLGIQKHGNVVSQNKMNVNNDIWITGNIGDSYIGLNIAKNKINVDNIKEKKFFLKKYYYPSHCILGPKMSKYVNSMKDISDGFLGDLNKMLDNNFGAKINIDQIPLSPYLRKLIKKKIIGIKDILNTGDNYELILISDKKFRNRISYLGKINNIKISRIGKITQNLKIIDDSNFSFNISREYDHFR